MRLRAAAPPLMAAAHPDATAESGPRIVLATATGERPVPTMGRMTAVLPRRLFRRVTESPVVPAEPAASVTAVSTTGTSTTAMSTTAGPDAAAPTAPAAPDEVWQRPTWAEIVADNSPRVFRLAYRLTGNQHDAEDLTQDVFVRVFRSLDSFTPGNFEAWVHRITTNLFLDGARRRQRIRFDALGEDADTRLADHGAGPVERFEFTHLDGEVRDALMALRPEFRAAVVLCDIEGLPYEEVADVLQVKLGTVRSRIHRGRSQLRERLAHRAPGARPVEDGPGTAGPPLPSRPASLRHRTQPST